MAKGTIIYMGNFELPDKNASAHRVMNNGKIFKDLGYRVAYLGVSRDEVFAGIKQSKYCPDIYEEAYPCGMKQWVNHIFDTKIFWLWLKNTMIPALLLFTMCLMQPLRL